MMRYRKKGLRPAVCCPPDGFRKRFNRQVTQHAKEHVVPWTEVMVTMRVGRVLFPLLRYVENMKEERYA